MAPTLSLRYAEKIPPPTALLSWSVFPQQETYKIKERAFNTFCVSLVCVFFLHERHMGIQIRRCIRKFEYDASESCVVEYWSGDLLWALHLNLCHAHESWLAPSFSPSLSFTANLCSCLPSALSFSFFLLLPLKRKQRHNCHPLILALFSVFLIFLCLGGVFGGKTV